MRTLINNWFMKILRAEFHYNNKKIKNYKINLTIY